MVPAAPAITATCQGRARSAVRSVPAAVATVARTPAWVAFRCARATIRAATVPKRGDVDGGRLSAENSQQPGH